MFRNLQLGRKLKQKQNRNFPSEFKLELLGSLEKETHNKCSHCLALCWSLHQFCRQRCKNACISVLMSSCQRGVFHADLGQTDFSHLSSRGNRESLQLWPVSSPLHETHLCPNIDFSHSAQRKVVNETLESVFKGALLKSEFICSSAEEV